MDFASTLNQIMVERGYSKYRVAKIIGVSQSTIQNWLTGKTEPYAKEWDRIAHALGVSPADLFTGAEAKKAPVRQDERSMWDDRKHKMLITLFERLSPEDQNDVIFELLQKAQSQLDQDSQK